jgi:hypothetical protein
LIVDMPSGQLPKSLVSSSFYHASPTQLWGRRTYGSENLCSAMQKGFFDSIGQRQPSMMNGATSGLTRRADLALANAFFA